MNLNTFNSSLSAYWSLDESSGTRLDCINGIPLYQNGVVNSNIGIRNTAAYFDGESYLNAYNDSYCGTYQGFLFSTWVFFENMYTSKTETINNVVYDVTYNADNNYIAEKGEYFSVYTQTLDSSKKWMAKINGTTLSGSSWSSATTNRWYHVMVGASGGFLFFSVRSSGGLTYTTSTYSGSLSTNNDDLMIGRTMKGRMDETAMWSEPPITSINQFLEIENEIYQAGTCLVYNSFKQLWEIAVTVNDVTTYDPISIYPDSTRPTALSDVLTYFYIPSAGIEGNNASDNKATMGSINSSSLSIGPLAPGEISPTTVIRLSVPNAQVIRNIKIGLIDNGGIPFTNSTFGITTRNYYDSFLVPEIFFQGISNGISTSPFNVAILNIGSTLSYYVYLNVHVPFDFTFKGGTIRYKWFFDWG